MTLRFRNPQTGQVHQIKADVVEKRKADSPQRAEGLRSDGQDGKVDLYIDDSQSSSWSSTNAMVHLQIDKNKLSREEAEALAAAMASSENAIELKNDTRFNAVSVRSDLKLEKKEVFALEFDPARNLGADGQPIYLSHAGIFSVDGQAPRELEAQKAALFRAAEAADDVPDGTDLFTHNGASNVTKRQAGEQIRNFLSDVNASSLAPEQKAQARASAATLLTELISGLGNTGAEGQLKKDLRGPAILDQQRDRGRPKRVHDLQRRPHSKRPWGPSVHASGGMA